MAEVKNAFIKSKMNKDLDARLLPNGEYREGINIQVSKSEGADVGALENVLGNKLIVDFKTITGCNCDLTTIGLYTDEVNDNIYIFLTDYDERSSTNYNFQSTNYSTTANNYVYVHNVASNETNLLLTGAFLNFSKNFPILSVNLLEGILFWTDDRNQPRRINIDRATTPNYYTTEDQISVATYAPFQPIQLYHKRDNAFLPNGGSALTDGITTTGSSTILLQADNRLGLAKELGVDKTLIGATITAVDSAGVVVPGIPADTVLQSFANGNQITLIDRSNLSAGTPLATTTVDIPAGTTIYFNQNTLTALTSPSYWVTSMEDASTPMNPGGTYNEDFPGLTTNPNYNPKFNGDPDFLEDKFVRFSYRFKYEDGNYSVMAPFTQPTFIPKQDGYFIGQTTPTGNTTDEQATYRSTVVDFMENKVNNIFLQIPLPLDINNDGIQAVNLFDSLKIDEIEILYKESDALAVQVVDVIPRTGSFGYERFNTATTIEYNYQGNKPYKTLPEAELIRVYDKAPVRAHNQEIISNRLVYGNFQNKHTPPETLDYNVAVSDKYTTFVADDPTVPRPIERTVSREYPMHTVKQNRNYQVGVVLSDRYGRTSTTILSSVNTQATDNDNLTLLGDTVYFPYNEVSNTTANQNRIQQWPGDSIKILFNTPIDENRPHNLTTGWPGLYNGDPTSTEYNPLGWYSYKIVVKQTEQEYYNVYLPSIMNFYPNLTAAQQSTAPDPVNTVSFISLLNDNINKVPRDLSEVGPEQKQFRSSVQLFGRIAPHSNATPTYNYQFNPVNTATNIAISDTVSTISDQNNMFDNTTGVKFGSIYQTVSNPSLARISISNPSNPIGTQAPTNVTDDQTQFLSIYETEPVESRLDIYWETSSSGTVSELNTAIKEGSAVIKNFTTDENMSLAPDTWTFNLAEDITPGASPTATYSSGSYTPLPFFPYTSDASGVKLPVINSNIDTTSGFSVINGNGENVTNKFVLTRTPGNGVSTPDKYVITIASGVYFYYSPDSPVIDSFTFNFDVQNNDSGSQNGLVTKISLSEKLFNVAPIITCVNPIIAQPGATLIHSFVGVNGSQDNSKNQEDLTWSMTQTPSDPANGIPALVIDPLTGVVTDPTATLNTPVTLTVTLSDAGTNDTTIGGVADGICITVVNGNQGYETFALNDSFYNIKNICINQGPESSGFYWAAATTGSTNPVTTSTLPPVNREPKSGLSNTTVAAPWSVTTSATNCTGWTWTNSNRNAKVAMGEANSGLGSTLFSSPSGVVLNGRTDCATTGGSSAVPAGITAGTTDTPGGSAYIIVDFELGNYGQAPNDRPGVIWPAYLQYRQDVNSPWQTATDVEGNTIQFGGAHANTYDRPNSTSSVTIGTPPSAFANTGVKDQLSSAITQEGTGSTPSKNDSFESWMESKETQSDPELTTIGRKLFVVGRNQAFREPSGTAPSDAPDRFGEYRLITRYPYGTNISPTNSVSVTNPKIPTLSTFNCPSGAYSDYLNSQENQRVYLSFGDFYNPVQLASSYGNGAVQGVEKTPPSSFAYRVTSSSSDSRTEAEAKFPDQIVYAREWAFKYISQFYVDPQLTIHWDPGTSGTKWFSYRGAADGESSLNVQWGNEYSSTRNGAPIFSGVGVNPNFKYGSDTSAKDMKWSAQFDQYGKKIIRTAQPCVANLDPTTGGNNNLPTPPANSYQFGTMTVSPQGSTGIIFVQKFSAAFQTCNINALFSRLTNDSSALGGSVLVQGVSELTVFSSDPLNGYSSIGSISINPGSSQASIVDNGISNEKELRLTGVTYASSEFQPAPAQNWYINGVTSCP